MTTQSTVDDFLAQKTLAVVGASRDPKAFSSMASKELRAKGYRLIPVNPNADQIQGERCYPSLRDLPEPVGGALLFVQPAQAEAVVRDATAAGITRVWMQQGAESEAAIQLCQQNGIREVHGECILMFAGAHRFPHNMHRMIWKLFGKLPK